MSHAETAEALDPVLTAAPHRIGTVTLVVHDLEGVIAFYRDAIGLAVLSASAEEAALGTAGRPLLRLRADRSARIRSPREAGLFHTAFLMPSRADLGSWLAHAAESRLPLQGASDHDVSEAIYLADPEGNGIEIYADRPSGSWVHGPDGVLMRSEPLDLQDLLRAGRERVWSGFPTGGTVGHVHLQVGGLAPAESFYGDLLGFDVMCRYPGATFFGSGGYHHQLAANIWNSRGAADRDLPSTGLAEVELLTAPEALDAARKRSGLAGSGDLVLRDPWGTSVRLTPAARQIS